VLVPSADHLITFKVTGPGVIAAVDSADNSSHEPFQASGRRAFQGWCLALLKASVPAGRITVAASSPGLAASSVTIETGR
jgi:beta-galactosidase